MQNTIKSSIGLKNTTPLCFFPNGKLLCYHRGEVVVLNEKKVEKVVPIAISAKERIIGWSRFATRLLRFGIRSAIAIDNQHVVYSIGNMLYELDVDKAQLSKGWYCGDGIRPLIFTEVNDINGIDKGVYFGGYLVNMSKKPVNVYHRTGIDQWEIVYTFPQGTINHIHNIVPDSYRQCLWVFTGDFDEASAIWKVTDNFKKVERVACNDQKYRSCVGFALFEGLLYATDAPFKDDYIYLLNPNTFEVEEFFPIDGSCIYGCRWKDKFVFSSTVEGDGRDENKWEFLFGRKRGAGIKDEYVHLYVGNLIEGFREIYKEKKDYMPFSFQFGVFRLPNGINNSDSLFIQPVATKINDLHLIEL